jgi:hypothetical protein
VAVSSPIAFEDDAGLEGGAMWQVTCECGYRARGSKDEVVATIQEHGRTAHGRELTADEVLAIAIPLDQG